MSDSIEEQIAVLRGASDQNFDFYKDKLKGIVAAYRPCVGKFDRDHLLNMMVKTMMDSPNTREDLCYMLIVAVDKFATQP